MGRYIKYETSGNEIVVAHKLTSQNFKARKQILIFSKSSDFARSIYEKYEPDQYIPLSVFDIQHLVHAFDNRTWSVIVDMNSLGKDDLKNLHLHQDIIKKCIFTNQDQLKKSSKKTVSKSPQNSISPSPKDEVTKSLSANMIMLNNMIAKIAPIDVSVVLQGESGVGKEVFARRIHEKSGRNLKPWVAVNCPAIPDNLFESELFGHEKGSFTGADSKKIGKFQLAHGGTLFLDEIADLSLECQAKILRVLQERVIEPLGSSSPIPVDIRLVCASSLDLRQLVKQGRFREDLLYRLADVELKIPPLRDRPDDVQLLVPYFIKQFCDETKTPLRKFTSEALLYLQEHPWPGNVRELRSYVRRFLILNDQMLIEKHDIQLNEDLLYKNKKTESQHSSPQQSMETEKQLIERHLLLNHFNITKTAKSLKIGRATIYRKIKKYKIKTRS